MPVDLIRFRKKYRLYLRFEELYVYSISARWQHAFPHCSKSKYFASIKRRYKYACCLHTTDVECLKE